MNYKICLMTQNELASVVMPWSEQEGWNPGLHDPRSFYAADPKGFYLGLLDDEPIASISTVRSPPDYAFVGLYIVRPEYRGKGYGMRLWKHALGSVEHRNMALEGVIEQQENYKKSGFKFIHRTVRYGGILPKGQSLQNIVPLSSVVFDELAHYDAAHYGYFRQDFLRHWIATPNCVAIGVMHSKQLRGFCVARKSAAGYRIGPLFAEDPTYASELLYSVGMKTKDEQVYIDVPELNEAAIKMVQDFGMVNMFETARMVTKQVPDICLNEVFGCTSLELG